MTEINDLPKWMLEKLQTEDLKVSYAGLKAVWYDDHILCCSCHLILPGALHISDLYLWWFGIDGFAALRYANDCKEAMDNFTLKLRNHIKAMLEGGEESDELQSDVCVSGP